MANWNSLVVQVPGKDLLEPVRNVLETLMVFLEVLKALLNTIKAFLVDFGNPVRALVEALIRLIEELFLALKASGAFALYHLPNPTIDPNFQLHAGNDSFLTAFKSSLFDNQDYNRPQPRPGSTTGGFLLLMVQADTPFGLLARIQQLLKFFSRETWSPRFEAPRNFKATPVGDAGDPILSVADMFNEAPRAIQLSWTLPTSAETPDIGFNDVVSRVAAEFVPPSFLVERSTINPASQTIDIADIKSPESAGKIEFGREVFVAGTNTPVVKREILLDANGELVSKFTKNIIIDQAGVTSLLGQLGTFRWIDTDITPDTTYYYRVRAFCGDLRLTGDDQIDWDPPLATDNAQVPRVRWPSVSQDEVVVAGKPTGIVSAQVLTPIPNFEVVENLERVFEAAFTCDFHRSVEGLDPLEVFPGQGSLVNLAGPVGSKAYFSLQQQLQELRPTVAESVRFLETQGTLTFPWQQASVTRQSAKLADVFASTFLASGQGSVEGFRSLMQTVHPVLGYSTLEQAVFALTDTDETTNTKQAQIFVSAYNDTAFREALSGVVSYLKSYTGSGITPDWISVNVLRDIVPWTGQILYELLDKIRSLLDAFSGVVSEIKNFIDLLTRKIDTLERTLQFLLSILNLIETLQVGAYMLSVPEVSGNAQEWCRQVDIAGGTKPPLGAGGYSAGVALAYVGPDVTAFKTAFSIIFGG